MDRILKSGISLLAEIKVPFKTNKSIQNFQIKIFFTLIINFVVIFLAYYQTVPYCCYPIIRLVIPSLDTHSVVGEAFSHMASWQLLLCGKFNHLKLPLELCCGSAADSVEWKRRQSASQNKQRADIIACSAASTEKWKRCLQSSSVVVVYDLQEVYSPRVAGQVLLSGK